MYKLRPNKHRFADGAVLIHMGSIAVLGANKPKNMINNGAHESVGGMSTAARNIDIVGVASRTSCKLEKLYVFNDDYDTKDGIGVSDYIHVVDLARGHVNTLNIIKNTRPNESRIYNITTGHGYNVLEIIETFERINGMKIFYSVDARRSNDVVVCYSDLSKAMEELGGKAEYGIEEMCRYG